MGASSGTSSAGSSTQLQNSASEEDLQALMNQRKQKRMLSNRESARRSRMRKQKHLDDLMGCSNQLKKENSQILSAISFTSQHYMAVEAENSVLRTQVAELNSRLQSLHEILCFVNANGTSSSGGLECYGGFEASESFPRHAPLLASADMFQYC